MYAVDMELYLLTKMMNQSSFKKLFTYRNLVNIQIKQLLCFLDSLPLMCL